MFDPESLRRALLPKVFGMRLLLENLTPVQRIQYQKCSYFYVIGGRTGNRYRIWHGCGRNVEQVDQKGHRVCGWCFLPVGGLVAEDAMLAQKMALELFESEVLRIAMRF